MSDEEFARIKRFRAHVTIAPVDTVQYCSPRSPSSKISFGTRVYMGKKDEDVEKNNEGRMDPEPDQFEPPSASTGFETPGKQCHPNWETGRTTAAGCLTAGVGSNLRGNTSSPTERAIGTRAGSVATTPDSSNTVFLQTRCKPRDKRTCSEENKQFDPGGKVGEPPLWKAGVLIVFSFLGGTWASVPVACGLCFFCLSVCFFCVMFLSGDHFPAS